MKILVTGGLGVNGAWVVRQLINDGHDVIACDVRADWTLLSDIQSDVAFRELDVADFEAVKAVCAEQRPDVIAHLAAIVPDGSPHRAFTINAQGTVNVLEAARLNDVRRVVYTSSRAAYGWFQGAHGHPTYEPVGEDHPRVPLDSMRVYSASKIFSEEAGRQYLEAYGLEFCALRFATIYGPGKKARHGPIALPTRIIENALCGEPTILENGGDARDDMIYVKDVAHGIVSACAAETLPSWAYNIASGNLYSIRDFAAAVQQVIPQARTTVGEGTEHFGLGPMYGALNPDRAWRELGFATTYDLVDGVTDFVASMQQLGIEPVAQAEASSWETGGEIAGE